MAEAEVLTTLVKEGGFGNLKSPAAFIGKSGVRHTFSFSVGEGEKPDIVCDVIIGKVDQDETRVLSLFIKVFDVGPKRAILCVSPRLTKEAVRLAMLYNIITLESPDPSRLPQMIEGVLKRMGDGDRGKSSGKTGTRGEPPDPH